MNQIEFDILDELYLIQSFDELINSLKLNESELQQALHKLLKKDWIRCYNPPTQELIFEKTVFEKDFRKYHYLATKAGLLAHNSIF